MGIGEGCRIWQLKPALGHTWKVRPSMSTISPNQRRAALMNSSTAKKAMRLAAMLATSPTEVAAPLLAASRMFLSSLRGKRPQCTHLAGHPPCQVSAHSMDVCTPQALPALGHPQCPLVPQVPPRLPCSGRLCAAPLQCPSPHTHPLARWMLALPLNLDSSTSG